MRHPFDGLVAPAEQPHRRSLLRGFLAALAGMFTWKVAGARELELRPAILPVPAVPPPPPILTKAAGGVEAGGPAPVAGADPEPPDFRPSTAVRGEEGASVSGPGGPVTAAAFENGGPTTGALREEGAGRPGIMTTLALGEEGGPGGVPGVAPPLPVPIAPREATRALREGGR